MRRQWLERIQGYTVVCISSIRTDGRNGGEFFLLLRLILPFDLLISLRSEVEGGKVRALKSARFHFLTFPFLFLSPGHSWCLGSRSSVAMRMLGAALVPNLPPPGPFR